MWGQGFVLILRKIHSAHCANVPWESRGIFVEGACEMGALHFSTRTNQFSGKIPPFFCVLCIAPNVCAILCPCQISTSFSRNDPGYSRKWPRFPALFMARGSSASPRVHGRGVGVIREESMVLDTILLSMRMGVNDRNTYPGRAWMRHGRGLRRTNVCARLSGELLRSILWL